MSGISSRLSLASDLRLKKCNSDDLALAAGTALGSGSEVTLLRRSSSATAPPLKQLIMAAVGISGWTWWMAAASYKATSVTSSSECVRFVPELQRRKRDQALTKADQGLAGS